MTFGNRMLSPQEVAEVLGFESADPIRRAIKRGELPATKVCGRIRIDPSELHDWLQGNRVHAGAAEHAAQRPRASTATSAKPVRRQTSNARPSFRELAKRRSG